MISMRKIYRHQWWNPQPPVNCLADCISLNFDEYQAVYDSWVAGTLSSSEVTHGQAVLHLIESQWAFMGGDTCAAEARLNALDGSMQATAPPATTLDSQECLDTVPVPGGHLNDFPDVLLTTPLHAPVSEADWQGLFANWKAGVGSSDMVQRQLEESVYQELLRRWRIYFEGDFAHAEEGCERGLRRGFP